MAKGKTLLLFSLFLATFYIYISLPEVSDLKPLKKIPISEMGEEGTPDGIAAVPDYVGEEIVYSIRLAGIHLGSAKFNYVAKERVNGRLLNLMTFRTRLAHFTDTETIYSDPETLLPVTVKRDIVNGIISEKITEEYDQENYTVTITKRRLLTKGEKIIEKDSVIHNAILLPHYVRRIPGLKIGQSFFVNLPTKELTIKITSIEDVKTPAGVYRAYRFESTPEEIIIWISADERKIPVKIQGKGRHNHTLLMKEYSK